MFPTRKSCFIHLLRVEGVMGVEWFVTLFEARRLLEMRWEIQKKALI